MANVKGSTGYPEVVERFIEVTEAVSFTELHRPFLSLLPPAPADILDVGAGVGRDAAALARMGHRVVAVEPTDALRDAGARLHRAVGFSWIDDSLPGLALLGPSPAFDFVLASAVWQHLDDDERARALQRIAVLLRPAGVFAVTLRHGPAGAGTHIFPADATRTARRARACGLDQILRLDDQPSLIPGKTQVTWTRLAFRRPE